MNEFDNDGWPKREAWHYIHIWKHNSGVVHVIHDTNDDEDRGHPSTSAQWTETFTGKNAMKKAKKAAGVSRQGVSCKVCVYLNGVQI